MKLTRRGLLDAGGALLVGCAVATPFAIMVSRHHARLAAFDADQPLLSLLHDALYAQRFWFDAAARLG